MKWYVKHNKTQAIAGPMSEEEALDFGASDNFSMVFNEQIFSPKFSTSSEVDKLLAEMKSTAIMPPGQSHLDLKGLLLRAINTITSLSREKSENVVIECSLDGGLLDVESEMPPGVTLIVRDYDIEGCDETERIQEDSEGRECFVSEYAKR